MDSHQNKLFAEGNMIVTYIIPDFLLPKEVARFACTCRFARNAMKDYATCWDGKIKALAVKHGMKIFKDPHNAEDQGDLDKFFIIDKNYFEAVRNNRMYRVAGTSNVFRIFCETGIGTCAELRNGWAWTDTSSYYKMVTRKDTMWTNPIPLLKTVCWYNPSLGIKHVEPGEYSFFLRHALEQDHSFTDCVTIKVRLLVYLKGKEDFIHEFDLFNISSFPNEEQANHLSSSKCFTNSFVCHFNTDDYYKLTKNVDSLKPIEEYFEVCCSWLHKNNWWKGGYTCTDVDIETSKILSRASNYINKMRDQVSIVKQAKMNSYQRFSSKLACLMQSKLRHCDERITTKYICGNVITLMKAKYYLYDFQFK